MLALSDESCTAKAECLKATSCVVDRRAGTCSAASCTLETWNITGCTGAADALGMGEALGTADALGSGLAELVGDTKGYADGCSGTVIAWPMLLAAGVHTGLNAKL